MNERDALERLGKKLDARGEAAAPVHRTELFSRASGARGMWDAPTEAARAPRRPGLRPVEYLFIGSAAFFVIATAAAAIIFFSGGNTVSTKNVDIAISGPTSIRAGDTVPLQVTITNRNAVPMQLVDLIVEYPAGTRSAADVTTDLPRTRESLGTIAPGDSVNKTERAVIFGQANTSVSIKVTVEYRVQSSNAIYHADQTYMAPISASPASITITSDTQAIAGQDGTIAVTVTSNVTEVLSNVLLVAQYPPGFAFTSSTPAPIAASVWNLGDIEAGGTRTITLHGTFNAEDGETRVIHFTAGPQSGSNTITAPLALGDLAVTVTKPFIGAALTLDGASDTTHTVQRGASIKGNLHWVNNLSDPAQNVEIHIVLDGAILDRNSVRADHGFYRSADNTIIFNPKTDPALQTIAPGTSGDEAFTFATLPVSQGTFKNPQINVTVSVNGTRASAGNVPTAVTSGASAKVVVASDLALTAGLSRSIFQNSGSLPPKVDHPTTYTVSWTVTNSANAVANVAVSGVLPTYATYNNLEQGDGVVSAGAGGVVTWNVGDMAAGESRTVSFQILVTPSLSQVGIAPSVISDQRVTAFDRFTGGQVQGSAPVLTTQSGTTLQQGAVVP